MELRALGTTGIEISPIALGTVKIGRNVGVKYPSGFELPNDAEVRELLALAWDLGVNLIDTAPAYGSSEQRLEADLREAAALLGREVTSESQMECAARDLIEMGASAVLLKGGHLEGPAGGRLAPDLAEIDGLDPLPQGGDRPTRPPSSRVGSGARPRPRQAPR